MGAPAPVVAFFSLIMLLVALRADYVAALLRAALAAAVRARLLGWPRLRVHGAADAAGASRALLARARRARAP